MASEAQRIMNLSLMKIVASRNRKGGVSLHRNLLVASVLLKARDVYSSEMAGTVVIRDGYIYDKAAFEQRTENLNDENCSSLDADNIIEEEQILKTVNAVVVEPCSEEQTVQDQTVEDFERDSVHPSQTDIQKENVRPAVSDCVETGTVKTKKPRKSPNELCRKRKYTEVERAVLSIRPTDQDNDCSPSKVARLDLDESDEDMSLECNELSTCLSEWCPGEEVDMDSQVVPDSEYGSEVSQEYQSYPDVCDTKSGDDRSTHEELTAYTSTFHSLSGNYFTSSSTDGIKFSLSHPILVVSV